MEKLEGVVCALATIVMCCALSAESTKAKKEDQLVGNQNFGAFGYEILVARMEHLETKFLEQQLEMKKQNELILSILEKRFATIENKISRLPPVRSCKYEPTKVTGQYLLKPFANEKSFMGYCDHDKFGGGWLLFQHRFNGSVDFFRNWADYKNGFGQLNGEFWLGLEQLHRLTKGRNHTLLVELEAYDGEYAYAMYDGFEIGSEAEKYVLKELGAYRGTAGDSLTVAHKGKKFSTHDNDNDSNSDGSCAAGWKGAWWYHKCHASHLNGLYKKDHAWSSNNWVTFKEQNGLKMSKMLIREN